MRNRCVFITKTVRIGFLGSDFILDTLFFHYMRHLFTSLVLCLNLVAGLIWNTTYPIPSYLGGAMDCISKE